MANKKFQKSSEHFSCELCDYNTSRKSQYTRHLLTPKHQMANNGYILANKKVPSISACICGKEYKYQSSLCKHKKTCEKFQKSSEPSNDIIIELIKQNHDFKELIIEQNKQLIEMAGKVGGNTIHNTHNTNHTNNTNNTNNFNLQFFLNEQCKDALNIMEFVNTIKLQLSDLDMVGRLGYTEGISKIFIRGLKELDIFKRPIHCSDLKRETLYVKDQDAWEKENEENIKIKQAIKYIANKNIKQIPQWKEKNPTSEDTETKKHMDYIHILHESMGGSSQESDDKKHNKIIRNVAKEVIIDKNK